MTNHTEVNGSISEWCSNLMAKDVNEWFALTYIQIMLESLKLIKRMRCYTWLLAVSWHWEHGLHILYTPDNLMLLLAKNQTYFSKMNCLQILQTFLWNAWLHIKTGSGLVTPGSISNWHLSILVQSVNLHSLHSYFTSRVIFFFNPQKGFSVICIHRNATSIIWNCFNEWKHGPLRFILLRWLLWSLNTNKIKWKKRKNTK